jgi:hypothetical protein
MCNKLHHSRVPPPLILPGHSQDNQHDYNTPASLCFEFFVGDAPFSGMKPLAVTAIIMIV